MAHGVPSGDLIDDGNIMRHSLRIRNAYVSKYQITILEDVLFELLIPGYMN